MKLLRLSLFFLSISVTGLAQDRFEAGGHIGYAGFAEVSTTGGRPLWGAHAGVRLGDTRSLLFEYTQFRYSGIAGFQQNHNYMGLALHTEPRPWNRVRVWASLGGGAGVRTRNQSGLAPVRSRDSRTFVAANAGVGVAFDVGERGFVRTGVRAFVWGPGAGIGLAPVLSAGIRF